LKGRELRIPESELESLPEGSFYQFQIRGLTVRDRAQGEIGVVESVLETGGTDVMVVRGKRGEETLVPLCGEIVKNIDPVRGSVDIDAPEGLVSLNAN
jgi:16S rRNA processing protein RimM